MTTSSLRFVSTLSLVLGIACQPRIPAPRPASEREASAEQTVAAPAPAALRVFAEPSGAAATGDARYLLLGRADAGGSYRALSAPLPRPAAGFVARAAHSAWASGRLVEAVSPVADTAGAATDSGKLTLRLSPHAGDAMGGVGREAGGSRTQVALPHACTQTEPALLQGEGDRLHALLRCPKEGYALLLSLDAQGQVQTSRRVPAAADATLFLHQPDGDYLAVARQVLRVPKGPEELLPIIGTVPPPGGDSDTRELVRSGDLLLIVDGAAGRVIVMDAARMGWRTEKRFYSQGTVTRLRSLLMPPDRLIVVTAENTQQGTELFVTPIALSDTSSQPPQRIQLGPVARADHELLPIAEGEGGGALLVYSRHAASGSALVSRRLTL